MSRRDRALDILRDLARRPGHDEVKSDFRELLVTEFGVERTAIRFEQRIEVRSRTDALIGRTVFEAKSNLDREWSDIQRKMPDYLANREREEGEKFVGIASDGLKWIAFELEGDELVEVAKATLDPEKPDLFLAWLDGAVALKSQLPPEPLTIGIELGQQSVAFRRASNQLAELWARLKDDPAVALKRQLWSQLLKLVYGREVESDALWLQHTFLVIVAKAIGLAVLGIREDDPKRLLSGRALEAAGIAGAVESDFFDWVVADRDGETIVRRIMTHVRRFRLEDVESDVLKILYESLIDRAQRHGLGEYYTPDWLASKVVRQAVTAPLEQRVLDPACGSGAFLFHAVRHFLAEAEDAGMNPADRAREAAAHVQGMDIHPVAVIIARVTYLLALAPVLAKRAGGLSIPVYLGDAMQLSVSYLMGSRELEIRVPPGLAGKGAAATLAFPETFCRDPELFDKAVETLRTGSEADLTRQQVEARLVQIVRERYKREINREEERAVEDLGKTYVVFDRLRRDGRDSVWSYVARNLSRPLFLSANGGWAHVIVGNPPWVAYRHMSADLQKRFKELAQGERVYVGGKLATQNDLSALFTVRTAGLYLRAAGRLAFVLPLAALTRGQFERLRSGSFHSARLAYDEVWTMDDGVQPLFPVPSCVVFARRRAVSTSVPEKVRAYSGLLPYRDASEVIADEWLKVKKNAPRPTEVTFEGGSAYRELFRNGATLYPRMLCLVERQRIGRLGIDPRMPPVTSRRGSQDKKPWNSVPSITRNVEAIFLHTVLLGESILPFRIFQEFEGVLPITKNGTILNSSSAASRGYFGLSGWMKAAENIWNKYRSSSDNFSEQLNHHNKLAVQITKHKFRVVYAKSGTLPAASLLKDTDSFIDHKLYWAPITTEAEGYYLAAILNSETARARTESLQSRGQWGARDFDKVIFNLPIPRFNPKDSLHADLAKAAKRAESVAAKVELPKTVKFQRARALVREALADAGVAATIDKLVARLIDED